MDNLRLILILIGLAILALIWFLHQPRGSRRPGATRRDKQRIEPDLKQAANRAEDDNGLESEDGEITNGEPKQTVLPSIDQNDEIDNAEIKRTARADDQKPSPSQGRREPVWNDSASETDPEPEIWPQDVSSEAKSSEDKIQAVGDRSRDRPKKSSKESPKVVTLYIRARDSRRISGVSLLDAAIKAGLRFGDMNIFHRRQEGANQPVFSMANLTSPGSFDPAGWNLFETPGVTLFMTLPGPLSALDAWDAMLATGQRLAELLDAELLDDAQCQVTRQRIAQIREDMRDYERTHDDKH